MNNGMLLPVTYAELSFLKSSPILAMPANIEDEDEDI